MRQTCIRCFPQLTHLPRRKSKEPDSPRSRTGLQSGLLQQSMFTGLRGVLVVVWGGPLIVLAHQDIAGADGGENPVVELSEHLGPVLGGPGIGRGVPDIYRVAPPG